MAVAPGEALWVPSADAWEVSRVGRFLSRVGRERGVDVSSYAAAWAWSVSDLEGFWSEVAGEFDVGFSSSAPTVLADASMPGAVWFPGATLNYAEQALRHAGSDPAVVGLSQTRDRVVLSSDELRAQVAGVAAGLRGLGVGRGDRVVGYVPNVAEAVVAFLACASLGAVWSSCAPEFGVRAVVDRVRQIAPKVLFAVDGYVYGDKRIDRRAEVVEIVAALGSLEAVVSVGYLAGGVSAADVGGEVEVVSWQQLSSTPGELVFEPVAFDHPLYVLFSSGTTGLPKAIVHGHGGITLEHLKMLGLHHDLGPGQRFFWFTTTGWMMWNYLVSGLLVDATIVLFDGDPGFPDLTTLWRMAEQEAITVFGVSAPFIMNSRAAGISPVSDYALSHVRQVASTGAPLPTEGFVWIHDHVGEAVQPASVSGGTDLCTAFVGASPLTPVYAGEISCRCLGAKVEAYDPEGNSVIGERGELVITAPMPSMPVGFFGDPDGSRYREAYFDVYPGVWRHGDWLEITERGSCVISGRSDATLNRGGVRMGTAEFTTAVEEVDGVSDSLVVHLDDGGDTLLLFLQLEEGHALDDELRRRIGAVVRSEISPRHVPDELYRVAAIPRTISGKKMEVPVKRLFQGVDPERVVNPGAMADPSAMDDFVALAARHRADDQ